MGQLEQVSTTNKDSLGTITSADRVSYRYDASNLRFIATRENFDTNTSTFVLAGSTEYLVDHQNFTGYGQTVIETEFNSAGQAIKRISYTFGSEEITQTTSTLDPATGAVTGTPETLVFGHDGHGSVRVLFDVAAAVEQVFTYSAFGELLAIHNASAGIVSGSASALASPASSLTTHLYNGEAIDTGTGLYNFRARWYNASTARFQRLDPFAGNPQDPFSYNKYGFVHGDPVQGVDPTGMFSLASALSGMAIGGIFAGTLGFGGTFVNEAFWNGNSWSDSFSKARDQGIRFAIAGAIGGLLFPVVAAGLGLAGTGVGLSAGATTILEFWGGAAVANVGAEIADEFLYEDGNNYGERALSGLIYGLIFAGVGKYLGSLTRGTNARLPSNSSEAAALRDTILDSALLIDDVAFQRAAGIEGKPLVIAELRKIFGNMNYLISTKGGAAGVVETKAGMLPNSYAISLQGWLKPVSKVHELMHVASEAIARSRGTTSPFQLEEALRSYDPRYYSLWAFEELSAWRRTLWYQLQQATSRGV